MKTNEEFPSKENVGDSPVESETEMELHAPHPRLPQYTVDEVERAVDVIQLLIRVRDRCRKQGLIDW